MASSPAESTGSQQDCGPGELPPESSMRTDLSEMLPNMRLNETLRIGNLVEERNVPHADIYSVVDEQSNTLAENIEARVFVLDDGQPKLRKHMLRCIKRMRGRTILERKIHNASVVVIQSSSNLDDSVDRRKDANTDELGGIDAPSLIPPNPIRTKNEAKQKTPSQREAARVGQWRRRQARRLSQRQWQISKDNEEDRGSFVAQKEVQLDGNATKPLWDIEFSWDLILLYVVCDCNGDIRQSLTLEQSDLLLAMGYEQQEDLLTSYLGQNIIKATEPACLETFLRVHKNEIISLQHQQEKVVAMEHHYHGKLLQIKQEESQHAEETSTRYKLQQGQLKAHIIFQIKVVCHAKTILSTISRQLISAYKPMDDRISLLGNIVATERLYAQWKTLVSAVVEFETGMNNLGQLSNAYGYPCWGRRESAQRELESFENSHPDIVSMADSLSSSDGGSRLWSSRFLLSVLIISKTIKASAEKISDSLWAAVHVRPSRLEIYLNNMGKQPGVD